MALFSRKKEKTPTAKELANAVSVDPNELLDGLLESDEPILDKINLDRQELYEQVSDDDEVSAAEEDLIASIIATSPVVYFNAKQSKEEDVDFFYALALKYLRPIAAAVVRAKFVGYDVLEYIYTDTDDGEHITIKNIADKIGTLDDFTPARDGTLHYEMNGNDVVLNTSIKHCLIQSKAHATNPKGEALVAKTYLAYRVKKIGYARMAQFIDRYSQPLVVGKKAGQIDGNEITEFSKQLRSLILGGAIGIGADDDVTMLTNSANGTAFETFEKLCNRRIQKVLLGKVRLSELNSGSHAAQETEKKTEDARVQTLLDMTAEVMQHMLNAVLVVNQVYQNKFTSVNRVYFEFEKAQTFDIARANRDKIYMDSGKLSLTADYYKDILGYDEKHFVINETDEKPSDQTKMSDSNIALLLAESDKTVMEQAEFDAENDYVTAIKPMLNAIESKLLACKSYDDFVRLLEEEGIDIPIDQALDVINKWNSVSRAVGDATDEAY